MRNGTRYDSLVFVDDPSALGGGSPSLLARAARPAALVGMVVLAYHYSLRTLVDGIELDTPLAYLAIVPVLAMLIALSKEQVGRAANIHDRQVDYIIGIPLVALAVWTHLIFPSHLSSMFWVWRVDMLTLPFFVAGSIALLFGTRALWRVKAAVLFLFLAWPMPYVYAIDRGLGNVTDLTLSGLRASLRVLPLATAMSGGDGSLFSVPHAGGSVVLSVASACSGANGMVGFLLVGIASQAVIRGPRKGRIAWLLTGAAVIWVVNLLRILAIFLTARGFGSSFAIGVIHPYLGLLLFCLGVAGMVIALPRFGLGLVRRTKREPKPASVGIYRPRARFAAAALVLVAAGLGVLNSNLQEAQAVANSLGSPRLASFTAGQGSPAGWERSFVSGFDWARRFFGQDSNWLRFGYVQVGHGPVTSPIPVIADVINTSRLSSLSFYGIEACYSFHGFTITHPETLDLGGGVVGTVLTWRNREAISRTTLYWQWPIRQRGQTRYERVTLIMDDPPPGMKLTAPALPTPLARRLEARVSDVIQGRTGSGPALSPEQILARKFLTAFARDMVGLRTPAES